MFTSPGFLLRAFLLACLLTPTGMPLFAQQAADPLNLDDMFNMDLDQLSSVQVRTSTAPVSAVYSASKYVQPIEESPVAINVLTAKDIQVSGAKTLADLLKRFPGVWTWTKTRSDCDIGMMGMISDENLQILYLLDGQPISTPLMGSMQWPQFPITLEDVERVEMIRGGGSALYGANAYSGVINIITKSAKNRKNTINSYTGEGGINNHTFTFARTYDKLSYYATVGWKQTYQQGPLDPVNNIGDMNFYQTPVMNAKVEYEIDEQQKAIFFAGGSNGKGGYPASPGDPVVDRVTDWDYLLLQGQYLNQISDDTDFSLRGEYLDMYQRNTKPYVSGDPEKYRVYGQRYYLEANLLTRSWAKHTLLMGTAYEFTFGNSIGEVSNMYPGRKHDYGMLGIFVQDDWKLTDKWSFISALRYDMYSDIDGEFCPRGTLMYYINDKNTLRGSIGRSYRRSGIYTMYYNVTWPGGYLRGGGPGLPPQTAINYELEYRTHVIPGHTFKIEAFQSRLANVPNYHIVLPGPKINLSVSTHEYLMRGFILELEGAPIKNVLKWYANFTALAGEDLTSDIKMIDIPDTMFNAGFQYFPNEQLYVTLDAHFQKEFKAIKDPSQTDPLTGLPPGTSVPSFTTVDAKIGYHLNKNIELGLSAENLFNDRHWEYPLGMMRSRTLYADMRITW